MPDCSCLTGEETLNGSRSHLQALEEHFGRKFFTQTMLDDAVDDAVVFYCSDGNSEEEAFKAGVNSVYFYKLQQRYLLVGAFRLYPGRIVVKWGRLGRVA